MAQVIIYRKSPHTGTNGACFEAGILDLDGEAPEDKTLIIPANKAVGQHRRLFVVRDSNNSDGPKLFFTDEEWDAFLKGAKDGAFDPEALTAV